MSAEPAPVAEVADECPRSSTPLPPLTDDQKFEAVIARFQDHSEVSRAMTGVDLQVLAGFLTVELALGAWIAEHPISRSSAALGLTLANTAFAAVAAKLLFNSYMRRKEVIAGIVNTIAYLRYRKPGVYLPNATLDVAGKFRPWWWWYFALVAVAFLGVEITMLAPLY